MFGFRIKGKLKERVLAEDSVHRMSAATGHTTVIRGKSRNEHEWEGMILELGQEG